MIGVNYMSIVYYASESRRLLVKFDTATGEMLYISAGSSGGLWKNATSSVEGMFFRHSLEPVKEPEAKEIEKSIVEIVKEGK